MTWDYTNEEYKKQAQADPLWHLERLVNGGLNDERIDKELLKKYLPLINTSPDRRAFLELFL